MSRKAKFIPMRILSPKNAGTILTQNRTMVKPDPEMPISPMAGAKVRMHHLPTGELVWEGKSDSQGYYYPKNLKEHEEYLPVGIHQPRNFAAVASGPVQSRPRLNASAINCTIGKPFQWKPRVHGHNVQVTLVGGELPEGMEWSQEFGLISEHVSGVAGVYNLEFQAATKYGPLLYKVALVNTLLPLRVPLGFAEAHTVDMYRPVGLRDIRVKGGEAPFTYHVVEGELPEGMYVTPDGYLTGYPVSFGKSPIVFNVADARGEGVQVGISFVGDSTILGEVSSQLDFENGYEDELTGGWVPSEEGVELKKIAGFGYGTSAELTGGYIHHAHTEAYELPRDYTLEFRASFPDLDEGVLVSTRPDGLGHAPFLMEIGAEGQVVVRMSRNGGSWAITMESEPLEIDTEYFIAVGRNGDDLSLFINGETVDTAILDGQIYTNEAGMTLGADGDGSNSKHMLLDSFRLTHEALYIEPTYPLIMGAFPTLGMLYRVVLNKSLIVGEHTDFPTYIDLGRMPPSFWEIVSEGGGDIRCYADADASVELPRDVVSCDTEARKGELHVLVPELSADTGGELFIWVTGAAPDYPVEAPYGSSGVWEGYALVSHTGEVDATKKYLTPPTTYGDMGTYNTEVFGRKRSHMVNGGYTTGFSEGDVLTGLAPFTLTGLVSTDTFAATTHNGSALTVFTSGSRQMALLTGGSAGAAMDRLWLTVQMSGTWRPAAYLAPMELGRLYAVSVEYDPQTGWTSFQDGVEVGSSTYTGPITTNASSAGSELGHYPNRPMWKGIISDFRIYKGAFSSDRRATDLNNLCRIGGLVDHISPLGEVPNETYDPHWDKVVALLHFDGDLTDETGRIWSSVGASTFSNTGLAGSPALAGAITTPFSVDMNLLNHDFTIEFWVMADSWSTWASDLTGNPPMAFGNTAPEGTSNHWSLGPTRSGRLVLYAYNGGDAVYLTSTREIPLGILTHVSVMRQGDEVLMSIGGVVEVVGTVGSIVLGSTNPFTVGRYNKVTRVGVQDELRITKGVARYTENFTPPTEPFPSRGLA